MEKRTIEDLKSERIYRASVAGIAGVCAGIDFYLLTRDDTQFPYALAVAGLLCGWAAVRNLKLLNNANKQIRDMQRQK